MKPALKAPELFPAKGKLRWLTRVLATNQSILGFSGWLSRTKTGQSLKVSDRENTKLQHCTIGL